MKGEYNNNHCNEKGPTNKLARENVEEDYDFETIKGLSICRAMTFVYM